ncbi:hypothetical protein JXO52_06545 [bacterium]|nr:hypothetical protein [bacterium]
MAVTVSALVYTGLMAVVVIFQPCLALGLPWGEASMGGRFKGTYSPVMRAVSVINMIILSGLALIVLAKAELVLPGLQRFADRAVYGVAGFPLLSVILNLITPSRIERMIWAPVTAVQLVAVLIIVFSGYTR